jgi:hypothetical protein
MNFFDLILDLSILTRTRCEHSWTYTMPWGFRTQEGRSLIIIIIFFFRFETDVR